MTPRGRVVGKGARIEWRGPQVTRIVLGMVEDRLDRAAIIVENHIKSEMQGPKSGAMPAATHRKTRRKAYQPTRRSAAGEFPAVQTRALLGSITSEKSGPLKRIIGSNLPYAYFLETKTGSGRRPWLQRGLTDKWNELKRLFES